MGIAEFCEFYAEFTPYAIAVRLIFATLFGGVIGFERATRHHTAGIRTFSLVCLGAAISSIVNIYMVNTSGAVNGDISRIPAQVVSGIGFLGVGTIIITGKNQVKGLTTAATLWVTAMLGIMLGVGMLDASVIAFVLIIVTVLGIARISRHQEKYNRFIELYLEIEKSKIGLIYEFMNQNEYEICSIEKKKDKTLRSSEIVLLLVVNLKKRMNHAEVFAALSQIDGVHYMEEL